MSRKDLTTQPNRVSPSASLSDEQLARRHVEIQRGLTRSNTATGVALLISILLASAAVFYAFQAEQNAAAARLASQQTTAELWNAELARAQALRLSGKVGRRQESLQAIRNAISIRPSWELRNEAIAALALMDVQPDLFSRPIPVDIEALGFSPDRQHYALGNRQGRVSLHQRQDHQVIGEMELPGQGVMSLDFSPDSQWLAARFRGGALRLWNLRQNLMAFQAVYKQTVFSEHTVLFHPNGELLLVGTEAGEVRLIDLLKGSEQPALGIGVAPAALALDLAGKQLAVATENQIQIWDFPTRRWVRSLPVKNHITHLAWHPDGRNLALAVSGDRLALIDTLTAKTKVLPGHTSLTTRVLFDPAGDHLVSTSWDGTTRFWDGRSGRPLLINDQGFARMFHPDGEMIYCFKEGMAIGEWKFISSPIFGVAALPLGALGSIFSIDFSRDGQWLACGSPEGVHLWRARDKRYLGTAALSYVHAVAFSSDSRSLVVGGRTGLHLIPLRDTREPGVASLGRPERLGSVTNAYFTKGSVNSGQRRWLSAGYSRQVAMVDLENPDRVRLLLGPGTPSSIVVSPNGRWLAHSTWKGYGTRIIEVETQQPLRELEDDGGIATFSPDGRQLVVGTATEILFYETASWNLFRRIARNTACAHSGIVAFSDAGDLMAFTPTLHQVQLLIPETGEIVAALNAPDPDRIADLSFSPDGSLLAVAADNSEIQLWNLAQLRQELAALKLDWTNGNSTLAAAVNQPDHPESTKLDLMAARPAYLFPQGGVWFSGVGALLAGVFAFYSIRHHRRLVNAYEEVESVATERRQQLESTQDQLLHSQKMKALGTLAAGIAHDFNNLLSIIRMSGQLIRRQSAPTGSSAENLAAIEQASVQGKEIVRSILGYSRQPQDPIQPYSVNTVVSETLSMLSKQFLSGIVLTLELEKTAPNVTGDKNRLEQIILNLIVNAAEAMHGRGKLVISVRITNNQAVRKGLLAPAAAAQYIELMVRDAGPGIDPEHISRVFEPFFSTKQTGTERGTGLGLTTVYTIAQQEGFGLDVETAPGRGATFRIIIPVDRLNDAS